MSLPASACPRSSLGVQAVLLFLLCHVIAAGQPAALAGQESRTIPRIDTPIDLDGRVSESAWKSVPPLPVVMFAPEYRGRTTERTEIRFAHDGEYLYASAVFHDSDPSGIRANALVRDDDAEDDFFNVVIDTFGDGESAVWFLVTPRGNRVDGAITDNAEGPGWNHVEYDSFWDATASISEEGWSAEMRIPFTSLRFNRDANGQVQMGLIAGRYISRKGERHVFPDIRPGPAVAQYKPSLAGNVDLEGVESGRPLYIRPYALGGVERLPQGTATDYESVREIGGDIKVGLTNDITLDLSLNTDFAQAEVDDQRVNLTRYSLLFPEKRAFFLERSGTFTLDAGEAVRLFHSRTTGLGPQGEPLTVYGGARLVGRLGGWDVGALNMHTAGPGNTGNQNAGVFRVRRDVLGHESYVGGILTTAHARAQGLELAVGLDGVLRVVGDDYLTFAMGLTPGGEAEALGRESLLHAQWERRDHEGWSYRGELTRVGSAFQPALGFVARTGLTTFAGALGYGWFGGRLFQASRVDLGAVVSRRHEDGEIEAARVGLSWTGEKRGGGVAKADLSWREEGLPGPFHLGKATIPPGTHRFVEGEVFIETPRGRRVRGSLSVSGGEFFDGYRLTGTLGPTWALSPHLELSGHVEANRVWFPSRDEEFTAKVGRLRIRISPSTRLAVHALVQHNSTLDVTATNLRIRYTIQDGNDIYVVFNDGRGGSGAEVPDGGLTTRTRSLLLKYSATIR